MPTETPPPSPAPTPKPAQPSSAGLIGVATVAIAALGFGAYAAFFREAEPVPTRSSTVTVSSADVESRLAALEQKRAAQDRRLAALEEDVAKLEKKPAAPVTNAPPAAPVSAAPAPGAAPVETAQPATMAAVSSSAANPGNAGSGPFHVVPNVELKGRLGRLVVEFPQGNEVRSRTEAFKAGETKGLRTEFGNVAVEMTAGAYDLNIGGAIVANVPIQSGHDTHVHVGVLRLNATGNTRFELFPPGEKKSLGTYFGQNDVGLPVGTVEVEVNGQREQVTIPSGGIAEY